MITTYQVYMQIADYFIFCHKELCRAVKALPDKAKELKSPIDMMDYLLRAAAIDDLHRILEKYSPKLAELLKQ